MQEDIAREPHQRGGAGAIYVSEIIKGFYPSHAAFSGTTTRRPNSPVSEAARAGAT
jgi:hypothetical protein